MAKSMNVIYEEVRNRMKTLIDANREKDRLKMELRDATKRKRSHWL